jgi:CRISPR-associated endonuclease/helicase Cas3
MENSAETTGIEASYFRYWGKAHKEGEEGAFYHLLPYHCLDVAAVGQVLLQQHASLRKSLAALIGLDETDLVCWLPFLLVLHDIGKFSASFQNLRPDLFDTLQQRQWPRNESPRHDNLGYLLWCEHLREHFRRIGLLPPQRASGLRAGNASVGLEYWIQAVTGHHGVPPQRDAVPGRSCDYFAMQDVEAATAFAADIVHLLLPPDTEFPQPDIGICQKSSWWLAGFAVLCDWLGSNRNYFPFSKTAQPLQSYWSLALDKAATAISDTELLPASIANAMTLKMLFAPKIDIPTPLQAYCEQLELHEGPQLFILEDVTGAGKTEAAVMLAHRMMTAGNAQGVYFGLPTMATANAMYDRMAGVYRRLFQENSKPSLVLAHGARDLSAHFRQAILPVAEEKTADYGDDTEPANSHCSSWLADNRKKALLAEVGVGTIDQALMAILPVRHQSLRLFGLLGKLLLVDEVHACDTYMNRLLCRLLQAHAASGGSAILLSATLPAGQRQQLVNVFTDGAGWDKLALRKTDADDYPLFTHLHVAGLDETGLATRDSVRRHVVVDMAHLTEAAEGRLAEAVVAGQCVCWIRNTVGDARESFAQLRNRHPDWRIDLFHARYAMQDRLDIEQRIVQRFGPQSTASGRRGQVLIATQVVEQSLDLDFDLLITDLAPIDLIIQRAGRLHRHQRGERGEPVLVVNGPDPDTEISATWFKDYFKGAAYVYPHHGQLWLTAKLLKQQGGFRMPEDARSLIEGVYASADYPSALEEVSLEAEGRASASGSLGALNTLNIENGYNGDDENRWWDEARTPTRLAEVETTTVYLARWNGTSLEPWINDSDHPWPRSAVQIRRDWANAEAPSDDITIDIIDACRERLPARGKWGVLLPLVKQECGFWSGQTCNERGEVVMLRYDLSEGLLREE